MIAAESNKYQDLLMAIRQVIQTCVVSSDFDVDKLAQFDIEFLFLQINAASKTNILSPVFQNTKCTNGEDNKCAEKFEAKIDLRTIKVMFPNEDFSEFVDYDSKSYGYTTNGKKIMFDDSIGVMISYPTFDDLKQLSEEKTAIQMAEDLLISCIRQVFDDKTVFTKGKEFNDEEIREFLLNLSSSAKAKLDEFMNRLPVLREVVPFSCKKCGFQSTAVLIGLQDFLA